MQNDELVLTQGVKGGQWQQIWTCQVQCGPYWDIAQTVEPPPTPFPEEETDSYQPQNFIITFCQFMH